ncbi:acyl-ACP--UDP-N-acetylglucosamine O-acyltransferase [Marivibrio halodurans]|uniref:Acyl-[acyl-carrier-protein]--UDP-N-acetylglucosamine O-acyltransferase n=1 Tax=Marivibrio halodurans TaxID=2039722 RepID=A0A8J7UZA1_9PROT|nr:acyl-ACP--UDP-N-acetylglucosamine O-acyltransferase [Marivibrio halodurans]MBP5855466.1 acyl-ACP--UDP-N-acetylglucosamine O-acyltransferase [Marivibrio halodurans]
MAEIHPTAIVDPKADIADDVHIGPYCIVGPDVVLGAGVRLRSHVVVEGRTRIGAGTEIYPFASIGLPPQDLKYKGEPSELVIGSGNRIREYVTMNPGTEGGGMLTKVGDNCLFMASAHVAHDCRVGDGVIMANNATLAGHVVVGDHVIIGGLSAVHQFVRIGHQAMIGGMSGVENDVIPFGSVMGERANLCGLNIIGLKRRGFEKNQIHALRAAYKALFAAEAGTLGERVEAIAKTYEDVPAVGELVSFIREGGARGVTQPKPADNDA